MQSARAYFDYLNHAYVAVHKAKEDLFWTTYMATSDDHAGFVRAEGAYKEFVGDPAKLTKTRDQIAVLRAAPRECRAGRAPAWPRRMAGALRGPHHRQPARAAR